MIDELTITAKYGENVSQLWPDKRTDLIKIIRSSGIHQQMDSVMQSGIQTMPPNNQAFYNRANSGTENHLVYWLQDCLLTRKVQHLIHFHKCAKRYNLWKFAFHYLG